MPGLCCSTASKARTSTSTIRHHWSSSTSGGSVTSSNASHQPEVASTPCTLAAVRLTLARYVMATRPESTQIVFEIDGALVELVRSRLPWQRNRRLRVRVGDARAGLAALADASCDLVVRDAFRDAVVPASLRTVECAIRVRECLRGNGVYAMNVADRAPFATTGVELATLLEAFSDVAVISEPGVLRGRRHGNLIIVAANRATARKCDRASGRRRWSAGQGPRSRPGQRDGAWPPSTARRRRQVTQMSVTTDVSR